MIERIEPGPRTSTAIVHNGGQVEGTIRERLARRHRNVRGDERGMGRVDIAG